jgi:acetolactate synthase small subunit
MRVLIIFAFAFIGGYLFTESWATEPKPVSDIDALLKKIQQNTQAVGQATKQAHEVSEKLVEEKVAEKEHLKEAVAVAESKVEQMAVVNEMYAAKMISVGLDTTVVAIDYKGEIYDAFLNYVEEGGTEDFEYFRLYLWQPK